MATRTGIPALGLLALVCWPLAGCGQKELPFAEVEGVLSFRDKPLGNVQVRFIPEPEKENLHAPESEAITDAQGRYRLRCPGKNREGAVVGRHRVTLYDLNMRHSDGERPAVASRIPMRYAELARSGLIVEVKPGPQTVPLQVKEP